jgi:hypothetical protein
MRMMCNMFRPESRGFLEVYEQLLHHTHCFHIFSPMSDVCELNLLKIIRLNLSELIFFYQIIYLP